MIGQSNPVSNLGANTIEVLDAGKQNDHEQQIDDRSCLTKCFKWVAQHPVKAAVIAGSAVALTSGVGVYCLAPMIAVALSNRTVAPANCMVPSFCLSLPSDDAKALSSCTTVAYGFCDPLEGCNDKQAADLKCCKVDDKTRRWALTNKCDMTQLQDPCDMAQLQDPCSNYNFKGGALGCGFDTKVYYSENGATSDEHSMTSYCFKIPDKTSCTKVIQRHDDC